MKDVKKLPTNQLEKYSTVFMQLGLVLSLFIAFVSLEYETEEKNISIAENDLENTLLYTPDDIPIIFTKEPVKKKAIEHVQPRTTDLSNIKKVDNEEQQAIENVITPPDVTPVPFNLSKVKELVEDDTIEEDDEPKIFSSLEEAPIYKGCEGLSKAANKKCFEKKIKTFVQRNFSTGLAEDLGLSSGKHKILTQFIIDKNGNITNVKIRAPHNRIVQEVDRIVHKIPKFIPGKQNGKEVKVRYILPIVFRVD